MMMMIKKKSNIPGKHTIKKLQKTAILGTAYILQKVLAYKYKIFNTGSNITCTINCYYRIAATLHTPEIIVNTLHKGVK